jgi:hypothetical protein
VPTDDVLDARFVAALWPLALAGWPFPVRFVKTFPSLRRKSLHKTEETRVTAVVPPEMLSCWLLPAIALARHFTGDAPLSAVVVQPPAEPSLEVDLEEFLGDVNEATRLALLSGDPTVTVDLDAVAPFWVSFRGVPPRKETQNDEEEVEAALRALEDAGPAQAAALFIAALGGGLSARARARAVPFLGAAESGT